MSDDASNNNGGQVEKLMNSVFRWLMIFVVVQFGTKWAQENGMLPKPRQDVASPSKPQLKETKPYESKSAIKSPIGATKDNKILSKLKPACIWGTRAVLDLHVYITDSQNFTKPDQNDHTALGEWHAKNLAFGNTGLNNVEINSRKTNITFPLSKAVQYNETHVYAHVFLERQIISKSGKVRNPSENFDVLYKSFELTKHKLRKRLREEKLLIGGKEEESSDSNDKRLSEDNPLILGSRNTTHDQVLLFMKPSISLQLVDIDGMFSFPARQNIPVQIGKHMDWIDQTSNQFYPIVYSSEFWITNDKLVEVNSTLETATVEVNFDTIKMWKWQIMSQMEETWRTQEKMNGGDDEGSSDMFRTMLMDTNPYLLAVTAIVSVLHTVFDILAFKNDISFFKGKKSMEGLSLRSMVVNAAFQIVILLYLADNDTSFMVLVSNAMGLAIEVWKLSKAVKISLFDEKGKIDFKWEESNDYSKSKTKEYDEIATSHLLFVTMPLVTGYAMFSLVHQKHKGYYSWILNTLVGFIYMFGFVMMTPQLFINYKLQSVAHLNWRTMTYKSINTFIDDLFGKFFRYKCSNFPLNFSAYLT